MSTSRSRPRARKERDRPIMLPRAFADSTRDGPLLSSDQTKQIQELIDLLRRNHLTELEIEREGTRIRLRHETGVRPQAAPIQENQPAAQPATSQTTSGPPVQDTTGLVTITSPIVGTFYRSPSPDADPYVEEGDFVKKGQVLCIVEAMKLMNEIESEVDGKVVKILVESTKPVEYGQPLFLIDPKATE